MEPPKWHREFNEPGLGIEFPDGAGEGEDEQVVVRAHHCRRCIEPVEVQRHRW